MEFKSLKNIETSFRQIRLFGIVMVSLCAFIAIGSVVLSLNFAEKQREKIYVLDNGKSLMLALSQDMEQNRPAEAREHVRCFHELFDNGNNSSLVNAGCLCDFTRYLCFCHFCIALNLISFRNAKLLKIAEL